MYFQKKTFLDFLKRKRRINIFTLFTKRKGAREAKELEQA